MIAQNQTISSHEPDILSRLSSEVNIMFEKPIRFIHYVSRCSGALVVLCSTINSPEPNILLRSSSKSNIMLQKCTSFLHFVGNDVYPDNYNTETVRNFVSRSPDNSIIVASRFVCAIIRHYVDESCCSLLETSSGGVLFFQFTRTDVISRNHRESAARLPQHTTYPADTT